MISKIFLGLITQNQLENVTALTDGYESFDGLAAVDHFSTDGTYELLNKRKKDGFVEQIPYWQHHAHSMNHFLFHPKVDENTWIVLRDSGERISENFMLDIRKHIEYLEKGNINTVFHKGKVVMFKRFPNQYFVATPHWGLVGARAQQAEYDGPEFYSVRDESRDKFHFIKHYLKYYLILDSNHILLGLEKNGPAHELYPKREATRMAFRKYLADQHIDFTAEGVIDHILEHKDKLPDALRKFINSEKILNDAYRYYVLNDHDFPDDHDFKNMIKIDFPAPVSVSSEGTGNNPSSNVTDETREGTNGDAAACKLERGTNLVGSEADSRGRE